MGIRGIVTHSIGIVIPAYEPDVPQLVSYVDSLRSVIRPKEIRVELDAVRSDSLADRLSDALLTYTAVPNDEVREPPLLMASSDSIPRSSRSRTPTAVRPLRPSRT
jgi:hypothetical protein